MPDDVRYAFNRYLLDQRGRVEQAAREIVARARALGIGHEANGIWEPVNPFPMLLSRAERDSAYRLAELISSALEREATVPPTLRSRCHRIGLSAKLTDAVSALQPASVGWWCRVDLQPASDGSWKLIEVNLGGGMAGPFVPELFALQQSADGLGSYLMRGELESSDPAGAYVDALRHHWRSQGEDGVVAFVDWPRLFGENSIAFQKLAALTEARGAPAIACDLTRLRCAGGRLLVDSDTPCSIVVVNDLLADTVGHGTALLAPLVQAARAGSVRIMMGPHCEVVGSKLAPYEVLTSPATADVPTRDLEWMGRAIPITRVLDVIREPGFVWLQERRSELVLKPILGSRGRGLVLGEETTAQNWTAALHGAVHACVQDYVAPHPWQLPGLSDDGALVIAERQPRLSIYTQQGKVVGAVARAKRSLFGGGTSIDNGARWMSVVASGAQFC